MLLIVEKRNLDRKIAVILTGAGHRDGAEITEAVSALIALSEMGASFQCFAPDVLNESGDNVLQMSQRIARGQAKPLSALRVEEFDGLVFPGGLGVAKVLSDFSTKGDRATVLPDIERLIKRFNSDSKPIGFICIAPVLAALVLGKSGVEITTGEPSAVSSQLINLGAKHTQCPATDYISDRDQKVLSTPAYMYDKADPFEVFTGIRKMIRELVEMA
jgi:enhancing lycopene biosynthesis protein 2